MSLSPLSLSLWRSKAPITGGGGAAAAAGSGSGSSGGGDGCDVASNLLVWPFLLMKFSFEKSLMNW